jgi:hypothetical protein
MLELKGNLWDYHKLGRWIVITTNGDTRKDGAAVMGRGTAQQAAKKFPSFPYELGEELETSGNQVYVWHPYKIITLPVKHHWREVADLELIEKSLQELVKWADNPRKHGKFYMTRPGCGNGKRDWESEVKPICEKYLDNRFVIVEWT